MVDIRISLETGEVLKIREGLEEDAQDTIDYFKIVADETDFLSFSSREFKVSIDEQKIILRQHSKRKNQIYLLALINGNLVGVLNVVGTQKSRSKHIGEFGISVLKKHWSKKVGYYLMKTMMTWAEGNSEIHKLNLGVQADNAKAIHLYEQFGFEREGCQSRGILNNGEYIDLILMGKLIN